MPNLDFRTNESILPILSVQNLPQNITKIEIENFDLITFQSVPFRISIKQQFLCDLFTSPSDFFGFFSLKSLGNF